MRLQVEPRPSLGPGTCPHLQCRRPGEPKLNHSSAPNIVRLIKFQASGSEYKLILLIISVLYRKNASTAVRPVPILLSPAVRLGTAPCNSCCLLPRAEPAILRPIKCQDRRLLCPQVWGPASDCVAMLLSAGPKIANSKRRVASHTPRDALLHSLVVSDAKRADVHFANRPVATANDTAALFRSVIGGQSLTRPRRAATDAPFTLWSTSAAMPATPWNCQGWHGRRRSTQGCGGVLIVAHHQRKAVSGQTCQVRLAGSPAP